MDGSSFFFFTVLGTDSALLEGVGWACSGCVRGRMGDEMGDGVGKGDEMR